MSAYALRFVGVGSAQAPELGSACVVLERDGEPLLMIDCGNEALGIYERHYAAWPRAVFLTHAHFDHVGGMERLFYRAYFDPALKGQIRLYTAAALVPVLQERLASYPDAVAEGGANFWDAFQLVPVGRSFWHRGLRFQVFPVRHHAPDSAFGIALPGSFVFTGDTRPIPEQLARFHPGTELIAHDCTLHGNPSHTGFDDLAREYAPDLCRRFVLYHYLSTGEADTMRAGGFRVAGQGECFELAPPSPEHVLEGR